VGLGDATRQQALKPYFTTKSRGTGLGRAIVQTVVERAGGLLRIDSAPGRGTTVRLLFPRIGASTDGTT
jgi:signal transduction histidine kinase